MISTSRASRALLRTRQVAQTALPRVGRGGDLLGRD
eukprot:SAG22_NODE_6990_length_787_cov_1.504360_1_plen_35_part_01